MFHLFGWDRYYASGGADDLVGSYETVEAAIAVAKANNYERWHVTDEKLKIVASW